MFRKARIALVASVVVLIFACSAGSASADNGFHGYSAARETSSAGHYTGVATTRLDRTVFFQPNTGCTSHFSGDVVFQSEWIVITSDSQNWLELGTGHQCSDTFRYWYWGFGYGGIWFPLGTTDGIANEVSHTFEIIKFGSAYGFLIDGVQKGSQATSTGVYDQSGLESYSTNAVIGTYTHGNLRRTTDSGGWTSWAGFDATKLTGAGMCGGWNSATVWRAAENQTC